MIFGCIGSCKAAAQSRYRFTLSSEMFARLGKPAVTEMSIIFGRVINQLARATSITGAHYFTADWPPPGCDQSNKQPLIRFAPPLLRESCKHFGDCAVAGNRADHIISQNCCRIVSPSERAKFSN